MDVDLARKILPEPDVDFLVEKEFECDIYQAPNETYITFHNYDLGSAYTPTIVEMRIVVPAGYPQGNLDMYWTKPWVNLAGTATRPERADYSQSFQDGTTEWQRWSRHAPNAWRPGIDNLRTHLRTIRSDLARGV